LPGYTSWRLLRRVEAQIPFDPYDLSDWPMRTLEDGRAEIRYQLHTRNLELIDFLRPLARALPRLTFTLTTLYLDDSSIETHRLRVTGKAKVGAP
jgi:hypothetical protein